MLHPLKVGIFEVSELREEWLTYGGIVQYDTEPTTLMLMRSSLLLKDRTRGNA